MMPVTATLHRLQRGFTLVELMIAILVGLFLTGGLVLMMQSNRRSFTSQNSLSQLQDNERMAMNMIADTVQIAGYYPDPTTYTPQGTMGAITVPMALSSGQYIFGVRSGSAPDDTLTLRFATKSGDGILNCSGTSNGSGAPAQYVNTFYVDTTDANNPTLTCAMSVNGAAAVNYPLITGVSNLTVLYGVDTTGTLNNVNQYMTATQVTAATAWNKVISVQVTLTMTNPLYDVKAPNGQATTVQFTRTAAIMNQVGL